MWRPHPREGRGLTVLPSPPERSGVGELTPLEEAVDRVLRDLRPGDLATYGEIAEEAGFPGRSRAVGRLLAGSDGAYPWWRVVNASGRLVPGHEVEQARRLAEEGHRVVDGRVVRSASATAGSRYDKAYFDHWYRGQGFGSRSRLDRKVAFAVGATEYLLERPLRSVLDVGCGEGVWQPALHRLRPRVRYIGVDPSSYAVSRFGKRRNLRLGGLGELDQVVGRAEGPFDLVVCVDVLGYVPDAEVRTGLAAIAARLGGVALIEVFTSADEFDGDTDAYRRRSPKTYQKWFQKAGLARIGPHLYTGDLLRPSLTALEQPVG